MNRKNKDLTRPKNSIRIILLLTMLCLLTGWASEARAQNKKQGYWKQIAVKVEQDDYPWNENTRAEAGDGYFRVMSKRNEDATMYYGPDHKTCKGEYANTTITFTPPKKQYAPGDLIKSTYKTSTSHSMPCDGVPELAPSISCRVWTGYRTKSNGKGYFLNYVKVIDAAGELDFSAKVSGEMSKRKVKDITAEVSGTIPAGSKRDSLMMITFNGHTHVKGIDINYYYKWVEDDESAKGNSKAQEEKQGYWKQVDKYIYKNNNGEYFKGIKMDGSYGSFHMKSQCLESSWPGSYEYYKHKDCKGEYINASITYTEPRTTYAAGDLVQSTYHTSTSASQYVCGVSFGAPNIHGGMSSIAGGNYLRGKLKNEAGENYFSAKRESKESSAAVSFTDVTEHVSAEMPAGRREGDSIWIGFTFDHGRGEDAIDIYYRYEWVADAMPATTSVDGNGKETASEETVTGEETTEGGTPLLTEEQRREQIYLLRKIQEWLNGGNDFLGEHTSATESLARDLIAILVASLLGNAASTIGGGAGGGMAGAGGSGSGNGGNPVDPYENGSEWERINNRYVRRREDGTVDVTDPATGRTVRFTDNGDGTFTGPNEWGTLSESDLINEIGFRERNAGIAAQDMRQAEQNLREQRQQEQERQQRERESGHIESVLADEYRQWKADHDAKLQQDLHKLDLIAKYGTDKEGLIRTRINEERQAAEKDYEGYMEKDKWLGRAITTLKVAETSADVSINILSGMTGPQGKAIKDAYTLMKSVAKSYGQATASNQVSPTELFKAVSYGAVQGGLGMLSNHAGNFDKSLGGWGEMATGLGTEMVSKGLDAYKNGKDVVQSMGMAGLNKMGNIGLGKLTKPLGGLGKFIDMGDEQVNAGMGGAITTVANKIIGDTITGPAMGWSIGKMQDAYNSLIDRAVQISNATATGASK